MRSCNPLILKNKKLKIIRYVLQNRYISKKVSKIIHDKIDISISKQTVSKSLKLSGLLAYSLRKMPLLCLKITENRVRLGKH